MKEVGTCCEQWTLPRVEHHVAKLQISVYDVLLQETERDKEVKQPSVGDTIGARRRLEACALRANDLLPTSSDQCMCHGKHMTTTWLSHDCHMTTTWLSHDCHMTTT